MSDDTVIDTPGAFEHLRLCQHIAALKIETATGMSHSRGSVLNSAKRIYGIPKQTKAGMLTELLKLYKQTYGRDYGSDQPFGGAA